VWDPKQGKEQCREKNDAHMSPAVERVKEAHGSLLFSCKTPRCAPHPNKLQRAKNQYKQRFLDDLPGNNKQICACIFAPGHNIKRPWLLLVCISIYSMMYKPLKRLQFKHYKSIVILAI
jgi:hypothetical protein